MLLRHGVGHLVLESLLEFGAETLRQAIVSEMCEELCWNARHRFATHVVKKAILLCGAGQRHAMITLGGYAQCIGGTRQRSVWLSCSQVFACCSQEGGIDGLLE